MLLPATAGFCLFVLFLFAAFAGSYKTTESDSGCHNLDEDNVLDKDID